VKRLVFLEEPARLIFHAVLIGSLYLLFVGHNQPGGGFVGGLVAGAAISLRYLAGGIEAVRGLTRVQPWTILGSGLLLAASVALVPLLGGDPVLTALSTELDVPVVGHLYVSTTLLFDMGVYLLVVGVMFMVFEAVGDASTDGSGTP